MDSMRVSISHQSRVGANSIRFWRARWKNSRGLVQRRAIAYPNSFLSNKNSYNVEAGNSDIFQFKERLLLLPLIVSGTQVEAMRRCFHVSSIGALAILE